MRTAHVWRELRFTSGRVRARLLNEHLGRLCISFGTAVRAQTPRPAQSACALVRALTLTPIRAVQVRRAELHGLQLVTNRGVEMLLQWCPHLRALSIRSCPHVTPEARTRPCAHSMRPSV